MTGYVDRSTGSPLGMGDTADDAIMALVKDPEWVNSQRAVLGLPPLPVAPKEPEKPAPPVEVEA